MSSTSLTALIREVVADSPDAPPSKVAQVVAERTDAEHLHTFYTAALERIVSDVIRENRNATLNSKKGRSAKLEERRSWWARLLRERVHVGDSTYKAIGECTAEDFDFCINERLDQIGALRGQITKLETLRDALITHGVTTVSELPEGAVQL